MVALRRLLFLLLVSILTSCQTRVGVDAGQEEILVFLVRHAERADDGGMASEEDPHLSTAGGERALALASLLADAGITRIHSSDYLRTRETAGPLAAAMGVEVSIYNVRDLDAFAEELSSQPGRHLVVGHSNSTPALVTALGGDPHGEIQEMEYDRIYLLSLGTGQTRTVLLRFGTPYGM